MNKLKIFIVLIIILSTFSTQALELNYKNETTNYTVVIEDDANILSESEEEKLLDEMKPLTKFGNIIFKSIDKNTFYDAGKYASDYYHSNFNTESGTLFLIDMDTRTVYIFSDGNNYKTITRSKALSITDNVYTLASDEEYYECASKTYSQINTLLNNGKITEPMRYISYGFISIILSFFISFLVIIKKSKIKTNKIDYNTYNTKFEIGTITGEVTGHHSVYNPPSSSGGSSGGGGGGSSGGGGGHSF